MTTCHRSLDRLAVRINAQGVHLDGELAVPSPALGVVVFAHGSGSTRHSPRNTLVADALNDVGLATLLFDLLAPKEALADAVDGHLRFDIPFLASRLECAIDWVSAQPVTEALKIGVFGASTGAGAALVAAAESPDRVSAVVSRGGRPDLAGPMAAASDSPHAAHRRQPRRRGHRAESPGARAVAARRETCARPRGHSPVCGTWHARAGGQPGSRMVSSLVEAMT